jgi:hypothetical protein
MNTVCLRLNDGWLVHIEGWGSPISRVGLSIVGRYCDTPEEADEFIEFFEAIL